MHRSPPRLSRRVRDTLNMADSVVCEPEALATVGLAVGGVEFAAHSGNP